VSLLKRTAEPYPASSQKIRQDLFEFFGFVSALLLMLRGSSGGFVYEEGLGKSYCRTAMSTGKTAKSLIFWIRFAQQSLNPGPSDDSERLGSLKPKENLSYFLSNLASFGKSKSPNRAPRKCLWRPPRTPQQLGVSTYTIEC
jgi:hypothetical protein